MCIEILINEEKHMRIKKSLFLSLLMLTLSLTACFSAFSVYAAETKTVSVTLKKAPKLKKKTVRLGNNVRFKIKYGKKIVANEAISFTSSRPAVASVEKDGTVVLRKKGYTVITAVYKKRYARVRLKVKASNAVASSNSNQDLSKYELPDDVLAIEEWLNSSDVTYFTDESEVPSSSSSSSSSASSSLRSRLVEYAKSFVGVLPYVWGGNSLSSGTDCSGFVHLIYAHFGMSVPRTASDFQSMSNISKSELQPGDLVCYKYGGHVALYIGSDKVVHAKGANYGTCIDSMYYGTPTGYVRIIKN